MHCLSRPRTIPSASSSSASNSSPLPSSSHKSRPEPLNNFVAATTAPLHLSCAHRGCRHLLDLNPDLNKVFSACHIEGTRTSSATSARHPPRTPTLSWPYQSPHRHGAQNSLGANPQNNRNNGGRRNLLIHRTPQVHVGDPTAHRSRWPSTQANNPNQQATRCTPLLLSAILKD